MAINPLAAANAYRNQLRLLQDAKEGAGAQEDNNKTSFSHLVENAVKGSIDGQYKSEAMQIDALTTGKVDLSDLVTAVANAELTLNTVVAVRDRVINAYQDIIKMPM